MRQIGLERLAAHPPGLEILARALADQLGGQPILHLIPTALLPAGVAHLVVRSETPIRTPGASSLPNIVSVIAPNWAGEGKWAVLRATRP
jgi:hypothetical protein